MSSYNLERAVAIGAARLAGKLCLVIREEMFRNRTYMEKDEREPVTIADYGAQAIVLQHIARHFPADGTLAEERASEFLDLADDAQRRQVMHHVGGLLQREVLLEDLVHWLDFGRDHSASRVWAVDPIDGTKGFLRGDQFAVAVALIVDGRPVVGALACPLMPYGADGATNARGVIASAILERGALIEPLDGGPVRPMHVSQRTKISQARLVESVEVGHTDHDFSARLMETAGVGGQPVRLDSQAKYVAVADGRAEIYIRRPREGYREKVWDHAAGVLVVQEAGGRVTDIEGRPLDFSRGVRLEDNRGILATSGRLHNRLLKAIRDVSV